MNNNPNPGNSGKEKQMNAIARTTSVVMLLTWALARAARLAATAGLLAGAIGIAFRAEAAEVAV
jgi:hypothetical protein